MLLLIYLNNFSIDVQQSSEPQNDFPESSQNEQVIDLGVSLEQLNITMNNLKAHLKS